MRKREQVPFISSSSDAGRNANWWRPAFVLCESILLMVIAGACDGATIPPTPAKAVVYGRVTTTSGEPVDEAYVLPLTHFNSCDSTGVSQGVARTRGDGKYVAHVENGVPSKAACVTLNVDVPPIDEGQGDADSTVHADLRLKYGTPYDSLRFDLILPPVNLR